MFRGPSGQCIFATAAVTQCIAFAVDCHDFEPFVPLRLKNTISQAIDLLRNEQYLLFGGPMKSLKSVLVMMLLSACVLSGCYITPVRHLAADIALIQVGQSTREDVLIFMGDPDEQQVQGDGVEKWLYIQKKKRGAEKTPLVGRYLGSPEVNRAVITFTNGIVTDTIFSSEDKDDLGWSEDFSWQEKD